MNEKSEFTFSLYVSGIKLSEINPLESAKLLEALCKMLGSKHLKWGDIREGSADYAVRIDPQYFEEKVSNFNKSVSDQTGAYKTITDFLEKHPQANTSLRYKSPANDEYVKLYEFQRKEEGFVFTQKETIRGRLIGLHEGADKTDFIKIETISGKKISVSLSPVLAATLGSKYRTDHQLEISGTAKYRYVSYNNIELLSFIADSINEMKNGSLSDWISEFKNAGDSGWDELDNPIDAWLRERHE
ncbi:hypothetical protein [Acinetobacter soli]|uniref:hypothetical protein n=1 Tax=Acinetobacter soli TaxID=487316 RepID=UPI0012501128|nr:hypothetical protein [Acinetobacter soli]